VGEAVSVIIQVGHYQATRPAVWGGAAFFLMLRSIQFPTLGWPETKVVAPFLDSFRDLSLAGLSTLKLRWTMPLAVSTVSCPRCSPVPPPSSAAA